MKVLITGGKGFLGQYVASQLAPSCEVDVIDKDTLDVTDLDAITAAIRQLQPDVVCHLAALCGAQRSREQPHEFFRVNTFGTINVLEACRVAGILRFVLASSVSVYGSSDDAVDEASPCQPRHPYAASKVAAEYATIAYSRSAGMRAIALRPTHIIGEGYKEAYALGEFVEMIVRGDDVVIYGDGRHRRDFVHPEDVARAFQQAVEWLASDDAPGFEVFNISSGEALSVSDLADLAIALAGRGRKVFRDSTVRTFSLYTKISKAQRILAWKPRISTRDIIMRLITAAGRKGPEWTIRTSPL